MINIEDTLNHILKIFKLKNTWLDSPKLFNHSREWAKGLGIGFVEDINDNNCISMTYLHYQIYKFVYT